MKTSVLALALVGTLLCLVALPSSASPVQPGVASHDGSVGCAFAGNPVSDGKLASGEYSDSYLDPTTRLLVYFACENSTNMLLHVAIVTPWSGWVGFLMQASDSSLDAYNEVRLVFVPSTGVLQVTDAYRTVSDGTTRSDASLGGSFDVIGPVAGTVDAARLYEFSVPLLSADPYDSQLTSHGPFSFALEFSVSDTNLMTPPFATSDFKEMVIEADGAAGVWTSVELDLASIPEHAPQGMLVTLRDADGYPIQLAQLDVVVRTAFGFLNLGPVVTNEQGVAAVSYAPRDAGSYVLGAAYPGGLGLLASATWQILRVSSSSEGGGLSLGLFEGRGLQFRPVEAIVVTVLLSVWATFAYAFFVVHQTLRDEPGRTSSDSRRTEWRPR